MHMYAHLCVPVETREQPPSHPKVQSPPALRQSLSLAGSSPPRPGWPAGRPGDPPTSTSLTPGLQACTTVPGNLFGFGESHSGTHTPKGAPYQQGHLPAPFIELWLAQTGPSGRLPEGFFPSVFPKEAAII